jgi:RNA polymerase sigma factor (sigma-70 family)
MTAAAALRTETEERAFEVVVRRETPRLFGIAYTILRDRDEAADAVQDVVFAAWRSWAKTAAYDDPGPWLTRICVNRCISRSGVLRRRHRLATAYEADAAALVPAPADPALALAFGHLSRRQRAVVTLHYQAGYTLNECAALMGCRPGTVRSHLSRALASLRENLSDH